MTSTPDKFHIERGVSIPPRAEFYRSRAGKKAASADASHLPYPLYKLNVGESFLVPLDGSGKATLTGSKSLQAHVSVTISRYHKLMKNDRKFVTRSVHGPYGSPLGIRVWRVA